MGVSEFGECGPSVGSGLQLGGVRDDDGYADLDVGRSGSYLRDLAHELVQVVEGQGPTGPALVQGFHVRTRTGDFHGRLGQDVDQGHGRAAKEGADSAFQNDISAFDCRGVLVPHELRDRGVLDPEVLSGDAGKLVGAVSERLRDPDQGNGGSAEDDSGDRLDPVGHEEGATLRQRLPVHERLLRESRSIR